MDNSLERDNIIQWIFEKAFDQLTLNGSTLYEIPFKMIQEKTFDNTDLHAIINRLTNRPINIIAAYLKNKTFQQEFLFSKLKKKINMLILSDYLDEVILGSLLERGYKPDTNSLQLAILNNQLGVVKQLLKNKILTDNSLLMNCAEYGYEPIYFYLRGLGLLPNISIYHRAARGNSIDIIKDISKYIGLSSSVLHIAFQTNNTEIMHFLIDEAIREKFGIAPELITYPIMNANLDLMNHLDRLNLVQWQPELYYSALLSDSIEMIKSIEYQFPHLHDDFLLDTSKTNKGHITLLLEDIIYKSNHKTYFSHTMNYAVQSGSIMMVKYVHSKGYGITPSNIITAIKQGTTDILDFLLDNYLDVLPTYLLYYFGMNSFIKDKFQKASIMIKYGLFNNQKMLINDYKKESTHLEIIHTTESIREENAMDIDYLMKYNILFVPVKGYKLNHKLLTKLRLMLELNMETELVDILSSPLNEIDNQLVIDMLYLFGTMSQIQKLYPLLKIRKAPSLQILMEMMCYCQVIKFCYLIHHKILTVEMVIQLQPLITSLSDPKINLVINQNYPFEPNLNYLLISGKKHAINNWLAIHRSDQSLFLSTNVVRNLLITNDIELVKQFDLKNINLGEFINWAEESDLLEMAIYLKSISLPKLCH